MFVCSEHMEQVSTSDFTIRSDSLLLLRKSNIFSLTPDLISDQNIYTQSVSKTKSYKKWPDKQRKGVRKRKKPKTFILQALFSQVPFIFSLRITPCLEASRKGPGSY